jgi:hypothetical protein
VWADLGERMMVFDLHLQLFIVAVNQIAADAADDLFVIEGRELGHGWFSNRNRAEKRAQSSYAIVSVLFQSIATVSRGFQPGLVMRTSTGTPARIVW